MKILRIRGIRGIRDISAPLLAAALAAAPAVAQRPADAVVIRAENPLAVERRDEVIAVSWADLCASLPSLAPGRVRVVDAASGAQAATQPIDNDADGTIDELLVLASFWPGERKELVVQAQAPDSVAPRAHARHDDHRDDVAWESDRIAFRIYGQGLWTASEFEPLVSSGVDIWPKRVRDLIVDRWYAKGHDEYHRDTGEGADFYTVGQTLGAAGIGVLGADGKVISAKNFRAHRIIADGPIRAVFELTYDPWDAAGVQVSEVRRITIDAGQNLYRMETTFRTPDGRDLPFVTGTVKREGLVGSNRRGRNWGWLATWGPVERKNGGHGHLGTAVLMPSASFSDVAEIENHFLVSSVARSGVPSVQYAGAGWTASGDFPSVEDWWRHLDAFAERLANPIRVTLGTVAR
jgi:pectinesterase